MSFDTAWVWWASAPKARAAIHEQGASPGVMVALSRHGPMMIGCPISWSRAWRTLRLPISTNCCLLPSTSPGFACRQSSCRQSSGLSALMDHDSRLM